MRVAGFGEHMIAKHGADTPISFCHMVSGNCVALAAQTPSPPLALTRHFGGLCVQALAQSYWALLGRPGSVAEYLAAAAAARSAAGTSSSAWPLSASATAGISSALGLLIALLAAAIAALLVRKRMQHTHRSLTGQVLPPGLRPETTLVITDVQARTVRACVRTNS
jgi:hypothetical protein